MIPDDELSKVIELAEKYRVGRLYLFGSSLAGDIEQVNDYDFAVSGAP